MKSINIKARLIIIFTLVFLSFALFAQQGKDAPNVQKTKMAAFVSETGVIRKFVDVNLPALKGSYLQLAETRIRKVSVGTEAKYFYQIEKKNQYNNSVASIEYEDLLETIKALKSLITEVDGDIKSNPDYMENKFVTVDGFEVGYYVSKAKVMWFIKLEQYGSDNTFFVSNVAVLEAGFNEAKSKIEALRQ